MDGLAPKRGRGRPRGTPSHHVMTRMGPDLITRIDAYTEMLQANNPGLHVSRADTIRAICERFLTTVQHDLVHEEQNVYETSRNLHKPAGSPPLSIRHKMPTSGMRKSIIELLRQYPKGLSPAEVRRKLDVAKNLGSTIKAMARDGLLTRVETGRYIVAETVKNH